MDIESLHKYISINKTTPNVTEVLFAGQPCLVIRSQSEDYFYWSVNPVFAKLTYGANAITDVPYDTEGSETLEEAIATGLLALEEKGAFAREIDLPEDTYAAGDIGTAASEVTNDVIDYARANTNSLTEATSLATEILSLIFTNKVYEAEYTVETKEQIEEKELTDAELKKREEIVKALKKDRKFMSKYGKDSAYAIATAKAKEVS